ncbi:phage protein Gp13 family protein, partial [Cutibacterium acnes]
SHSGKRRMLRLLARHLIHIKREAHRARPADQFHFTNVVSVDNQAHIKLLEHLGAVWWGDEVTINGHQFRQFFF